jgi:D-arabinose 1-dehydrogenase-like Zn-dependent alcohol dehydrogenase
MHVSHGSNPFARYPRIIGHDLAGEIEITDFDVHFCPGCCVSWKLPVHSTPARTTLTGASTDRTNCFSKQEVRSVDRRGGAVENDERLLEQHDADIIDLTIPLCIDRLDPQIAQSLSAR